MITSIDFSNKIDSKYNLHEFLFFYALLSYDFSHNISVGLFHDKKCYNYINLFPYIFVGFICNGFSIKW